MSERRLASYRVFGKADLQLKRTRKAVAATVGQLVGLSSWCGLYCVGTDPQVLNASQKTIDTCERWLDLLARRPTRGDETQLIFDL
jgi:hypothetical protein